MQSRRVHEHHLDFSNGFNARDTGTGCLRLIADRGNPFADDGIQQGGFSDIRSAGDGYKYRFCHVLLL